MSEQQPQIPEVAPDELLPMAALSLDPAEALRPVQSGPAIPPDHPVRAAAEEATDSAEVPALSSGPDVDASAAQSEQGWHQAPAGGVQEHSRPVSEREIVLSAGARRDLRNSAPDRQERLLEKKDGGTARRSDQPSARDSFRT